MAPSACNVGLSMTALKEDERGTTTHKRLVVLDLGSSPIVTGTEIIPRGRIEAPVNPYRFFGEGASDSSLSHILMNVSS